MDGNREGEEGKKVSSGDDRSCRTNMPALFGLANRLARDSCVPAFDMANVSRFDNSIVQMFVLLAVADLLLLT